MHSRRHFVLILVFAILSASCAVLGAEQPHSSYLMFVGTYTSGESQGIYAYRYDAASGHVTPLGLAAKTENPSFLAIDDGHRHLYAVNEVGNYEGKKSGGVSAFTIDPRSGKLSFVNEVASRGADPCYIITDRSGKYVLVANYTSGNIAAFPIRSDGGLGEASAFVQHTGTGPNHERQEGPHAHWIETTSDNRFAVVADLGLDQLLVYRFNPKDGSLAANQPPFVSVNPGEGPRHVVFHPDGKFAYVLTEMRSTVDALSFDQNRGAFKMLQTVSSLPKDFSGKNDAAEIKIRTDGKFLYASNRGDDSIAVFAVDSRSGKLTPVEHMSTKGKTPRSFEIDPTGKRLLAANEDSGDIVVFDIDANTGKLTPTGEVVKVPSPVCIKFMPAE